MLTKTETEILKLIVDGMSNKQIAEKRTITLGTVKMHVVNILDKLGVRNRTEARLKYMAELLAYTSQDEINKLKELSKEACISFSKISWRLEWENGKAILCEYVDGRHFSRIASFFVATHKQSEFIVEAARMIPGLIAEIERLQNRVAYLETQVSNE